jgi:hypothetical protein
VYDECVRAPTQGSFAFVLSLCSVFFFFFFFMLLRLAHRRYMFGGDMVVAPISQPAMPGPTADGRVNTTVWLPVGTFSDWRGGAAVTGPRNVTVSCGLGDIPVFVRAGAVVPMRTDSARDFAATSPAVLEWNVWLPAGGRAGGFGEVRKALVVCPSRFLLFFLYWKTSGFGSLEAFYVSRLSHAQTYESYA